MKSKVDEVVELYFEGYHVNEILAAMAENKNVKVKKKKEKKIIIKKPEVRQITREECLDLCLPKLVYPEGYSNLDIKECEAIRFSRELKKDLNLKIEGLYQILTPKHGNKKLDSCFIGYLKEVNPRFIRLQSIKGYSVTYQNYDLISGNVLIKEA